MDTIESKDCHDFKSCTCGKVGIDGGTSYNRVIGDLSYMETRSIYMALVNNKKILLPLNIIEQHFYR